MKDFKFYVTPDEIDGFLGTHLKTDEMRNAFRTNPILIDLKERFVRYPRLTFWANDEKTERSSFASWFNALALRDYENPAVNDLYYLHEITHISTMPYLPHAPHDGWRRKMFRNELEASVMSEAFIYFLCPELRAKSFSGEIWVDRFVPSLAGKDLDSVLILLLNERDRIQSEPNDSDPQERRIHSYQKQNEEWARIWEPNYLKIEGHMARFYKHAYADRAQAARAHQLWIETEIGASAKPYPFATEVDAFADYCAKDKTAVIPTELNLKDRSKK
ncbi:MAG: hypothetical protein AAB250_18525 [Bdellovibrionota bacterium]